MQSAFSSNVANWLKTRDCLAGVTPASDWLAEAIMWSQQKPLTSYFHRLAQRMLHTSSGNCQEGMTDLSRPKAKKRQMVKNKTKQEILAKYWVTRSQYETIMKTSRRRTKSSPSWMAAVTERRSLENPFSLTSSINDVDSFVRALLDQSCHRWRFDLSLILQPQLQPHAAL